jgi:hypothetical protein
VFAGAYLVGPSLAGSALWSRRLPGFHLASHLLGLATMVAGLALSRYDVAGVGAVVLVIGLLAMVLNLLVTASRRSVWSPANLAFQSALFWLVVSAMIALYMLRGRLAGLAWVTADELIALHAHFAVFGFLAQVLLAVSLRMLAEATGAGRPGASHGRLAWAGWCLLNGGLMVLVPATLSGSAWVLFGVGLLVFVGIVALAAPIGLELAGKRDKASWGAITHATGLLLLLVVMAGALWRLPAVALGTLGESREWMRLYISLALLGPLSFAILGSAEGVIPRLVWRLRFAPWEGHGSLPTPESLSCEAANAPAFFALLLAWVYFAFGQWWSNPEAIRLGAMLMLMGIAWFVVSIAPALTCLVVGVTPEDLRARKSGAHRAPSPTGAGFRPAS